MPYELPSDLEEDYRGREREALQLIDQKDFDRAQSIYENLNRLILDRQNSDGARYHKGGPLHMIGYCLAQRGRIADSLNYFLLAYIEDVLTAGTDDAKGWPAYSVLTESFVFDTEALETLENLVRDQTQEVSISELRNPTSFLDNFLETAGIRQDNLIQLSRLGPDSDIGGRDTGERLPGRPENRVFIGGSYENIALLRHIRKLVSELGYWGIMAIDYDIPMAPREKCFQLLGKCEHAVFDISIPGGQNNEIEEANRVGRRTLLVFQAVDEQKKPPRGSSVHPNQIPQFGYQTLEELKSRLASFLARKWGP